MNSSEITLNCENQRLNIRLTALTLILDSSLSTVFLKVFQGKRTIISPFLCEFGAKIRNQFQIK